MNVSIKNGVLSSLLVLFCLIMMIANTTSEDPSDISSEPETLEQTTIEEISSNPPTPNEPTTEEATTTFEETPTTVSESETTTEIQTTSQG